MMMQTKVSIFLIYLHHGTDLLQTLSPPISCWIWRTSATRSERGAVPRTLGSASIKVVAAAAATAVVVTSPKTAQTHPRIHCAEVVTILGHPLLIPRSCRGGLSRSWIKRKPAVPPPRMDRCLPPLKLM